MNSERDCTYEIEIEVSYLNEHNVLKPYAYQELFAQVVERHLNEHNANVDFTMKFNFAWVLVSMSFEIIKPIQGCIKLFAKTWFSQRKGPFFRREVILKNEDGEVMFKGSTFSVLLDINKRTVYRNREMPFPLFEPVEEFTIEAGPTLKADSEYYKVDERKVYSSYIDRLGHVNNCRYGEFAYDALTDEERGNLLNLNRMNIYFLSELRREDIFSIHKAAKGKSLMIRGYNETKDCIAFDVVFEF